MRGGAFAAGLAVLFAIAGAAAAEDSLATSVTIQVIASDPETSGRTMADWAESVGGYFTFRSEEQIDLRVPPEQVRVLREQILDLGDTIVTYDPAAVDYREELARNTAAINSRNEALERILAFLEDANVTATLSFERELRSLLQEIEYYAGRNRLIRNEVEFATVTVYLSSRRRTIPEQRPSSFGWVNTVDLYRFLREAAP